MCTLGATPLPQRQDVQMGDLENLDLEWDDLEEDNEEDLYLVARGLVLVVDGLMMLMYVDVFDGRFFGLLKQRKGDAHEILM